MTEEEFRSAVMEAQDKAADTDQEDLDAVLAAVAEIERLQEKFVPDVFVPEEPPNMALIPTPVWETPRLEVSFTETKFVIRSTVDRIVELSGDVRDRTTKLKAGKESRYKLTNEGYGWVSVGRERYDNPKKAEL